MTTLLTETGEFVVQSKDGLWTKADDVVAATGWALKAEGMCRDDICVPLDKTTARDGWIDLEAFWHRIGAPVFADDRRETWVLGKSAEERNASLTGLVAPDFTLSDLAGAPHTLSGLRGKKIFLCTWASW